MFALTIQHFRVLLAYLLAELPEMLRQSCIGVSSGDGVRERILSRLQIAGRLFPDAVADKRWPGARMPPPTAGYPA